MQSRSGHPKQQRQSYQPQYDPSRQAQEHAPSSSNRPPKLFLKNPQLQVSHIDPRCSHESHNEQLGQGLRRSPDGHCKLCLSTPDEISNTRGALSPPPPIQSHQEVPTTTSQRYSYLETPVKMRDPRFPRILLREPTIPQSPATPPLPQQKHNSPVPELPLPEFPNEKPPEEGSASLYHVEPPSETHPAFLAHYAEPQTPVLANTPDEPPQPQYISSPMSLKSQSQPQLQRRITGDYEKPFVSPGIKQTPTYNPESIISPNGLNPDNHQPGQIIHPNMKTGDAEWHHGLCDCSNFSVCCLGMFCPCILYGKTQYRLNQRSRKQDPTDLLGLRFSMPFDLYTAPKDKAYSLCCYCCVLVQDENELKGREEQQRRFAGPAGIAGAAAYISPDSMTYAPPPR
ncbi:MAG: hypothetical protein M1835_001770 [Candelina submexicana]|nr:MAG: hypothetical protein M1835_001770 [Candelina submexicana]